MLQRIKNRYYSYQNNRRKVSPGLYTSDGIQYHIDPKYPIEKILAYATYFREFTFVKKILSQKGSVYVDIGANMGATSLPVALYLKELNGTVWCWEPNNVIRERLLANLELNKGKLCDLKVESTALGSSERDMFICEDAVNRGNSGLVASGANPEAQSAATKNICKVVTLDSYIDQFERCDIIKMDIEGFEYDCLEGARSFLQKFRPVVLFEAWNIEELRYLTVIDMRSLMYDYFDGLQYRVYKPVKGGYKRCHNADELVGDSFAVPIEKQNHIAFLLDIRNE